MRDTNLIGKLYAEMARSSPPMLSPSSEGAPPPTFPIKKHNFSISLPPHNETFAATSNGSLKTPTRALQTPTGSVSNNGILGDVDRPRTMSASSADRETAVEGLESSSSDQRPQPKKRPSTDIMESGYPRRRATIAVSTLVSACDHYRTNVHNSAKSAGLGNLDVMDRDRSVDCVVS